MWSASFNLGNFVGPTASGFFVDSMLSPKLLMQTLHLQEALPPPAKHIAINQLILCFSCSLLPSGMWSASFNLGNFVGPTASGFFVDSMLSPKLLMQTLHLQDALPPPAKQIVIS